MLARVLYRPDLLVEAELHCVFLQDTQEWRDFVLKRFHRIAQGLGQTCLTKGTLVSVSLNQTLRRGSDTREGSLSCFLPICVRP